MNQMIDPIPNFANELRILHRKAIYPDTFGGNLRTLNIARLARSVFNQTMIFSMDNRLAYEGDLDGIHVIQEKELHSTLEMVTYYARAITAKDLIIPYTKRAFDNPENALIQIEDPLLYPLLKKNKIYHFILDEHNVNWEMYSAPHFDLKQKIYVKVASWRDKENEKLALLHAAQVICCSYRDRDIFVNEVPEIADKISVIPNCVNLKDYDPVRQFANLKPSESMSHILFIGILSFPPNTDAVQLICQIIAPQSSDRCGFIIIGKNPPEINHPENVHFLGYVNDVKPYIADSDICIAPLRYGSGTRIKILAYMAMGKPVIATSKGAEGIEYTDGLNIIIEDTIEKYPEIIRQLLDDEKRCSALGREARKLIREKYDWELYRKPLEKIYREVMRDNWMMSRGS
jgi:glycosyltransferase involved in cell wall biosynthesis